MSKKCTPLLREAHFEVKMYKTHHARTTFGSSDVEKVHAVVARSTFRVKSAKKMRGSEHFWTFRCRFCVAVARECARCEKLGKCEGFVENDGRRGTFEAFSVAGAVQETCSSDVRALIS